MNIGSSRMVSCPQCKAKYDVSGFKEGKKFKCQGCGTTLTVPAASAPAPSKAGASSSGKHARAAAAPAGEAPAGRRSRSAAHSQPSNAPIIIAAVSAAVILVVVIIFLMQDKDKPQDGGNQQTAGTGQTPNAGGQPAGSSGQPAGTPGTGGATNPDGSSSSSNTGGTTPGSDTTTPGGDTTTPGGDTQPGTSTDNPGETPTQPTKPDKKPTNRGEFLIDNSIKGDVDAMLAEIPYTDDATVEQYWKRIEAYEERAVPILVEALLNEDTMVAAAASRLLENITGNTQMRLLPGTDPEDAQVLHREWKEWWCVYQGSYKRRKAEKAAKMTSEKRLEEIKRLLTDVRGGSFAERSAAARKLRGMGKEILPVLIDLLKDETGLADLSLNQLEKITGKEMG
ncbi:MAG: hypothetical protein RDV41_05920, partial [Planctomycetota bacterium]|nr:hypothetical protein [Planctomycetota bacterium]